MGAPHFTESTACCWRDRRLYCGHRGSGNSYSTQPLSPCLYPLPVNGHESGPIPVSLLAFHLCEEP